MKKKIFLMLFIISMLACLFALSASAVEIDYNEKATLLDGTVLPIYDENQNPLIWFIKDENATGMDKYASVPNNRNTKDDATSYVTFNINSTYGTNQLHDVYIKYWDAVNNKYVDYGEGTVVVYNLRGVDTLWCVGSYANDSNLEYVYMPSSCKEAGTYNGYAKLQLVDFSLSTEYEGFGKQAFRNCTSLREIRFGTSENGYELKSAQYGCLFQGCTSLTTLTFADISKITAIEGGAFENCYALTGTYEFTGVTSIGSKSFYQAATNDGTYLVLKFPNLVTLGGSSGDTNVFGKSGVQELYFGDDITTMSHNTFSGASKLWKVEFAGISEGFNFKSYTFEDCSALKAFSIPEGVTVLPARMFKSCTNLKAVYIPSTVTKIDSGSQDHSTFANCKNLYFVNEPFTFTGDSDIPQKPDVYYFPSNLESISGETFKKCESLNKTLVFGEKLTEIKNAWAFEAGINTPTLENIVFLGDVTELQVSSWKLTGKIYFCNSADLSASNVTISGSKPTSFCNAEGNTEHLYLVNETLAADCENNAKTQTRCFCGKTGAVVEEPNTALGHDHDYLNGKATLVAVVYADLSKDGVKTVKCGVCGKDSELTAVKVIDYKGYSKNDKGAMCMGYNIDQAALKDYESKNGALTYGFVASANNNAPLEANGDKKENVVKADLTGSVYNAVDFILTADDWTAESVANAEISINLYVIVNNAVKYITVNGYS
ncbi:MAG: leucine-rich repeat protein, partial [Clostridia bacterium]|nr:leucine-rich repeat protein [Clostridia bacterium]